MMLAPMLALAAALAQAPQATPPQQGQGEALRVFLDCEPWVCDIDFLRTEITFVNYMRDRTQAQVHVLVTTLRTGGGGQEYTLTFIGQRDLQGRTDTLRYISRQSDTPDETRRGLARILRLGLVRYTAGTPLAAHIDVSYTPPAAAGAAPAREQRDPWNRWVFRTSVRTSFNGEKSRAYDNRSGSVSARRVTEAWKLDLEYYTSANRNRYESIYYDTLTQALRDTTIRTTRRSWSADGLVVRSLGAHFSAGFSAEGMSSTYSNIDRRVRLAPAIEYNVFPYAQSTRRQLTARYSLGGEWADYKDTTLYGKTREAYGSQNLSVALGLRQRWGNANVSVSGTQYLNDARNPNVSLYGSFEVRLVRGLSVNAYGGYSFVRSQRNLSATTLTSEEVLLQLRQLRTSYSYWGGVGLSFTFGSAYNNVVNPRFGGGGGSITIMN
ncbi:MAG: hypothetical protein AAB409_04375 [Gemmatimonadota bacterium]